MAAIGQSAGVALMVFGAFANGSSSDPVWGNDGRWFLAICLPVLGGLLLAMTIAKVSVTHPSLSPLRASLSLRFSIPCRSLQFLLARTCDLALPPQGLALPNPQAVAVAIECCYQNTGLALTIALSAMAPEDVGEASGVPLVYGEGGGPRFRTRVAARCSLRFPPSSARSGRDHRDPCLRSDGVEAGLDLRACRGQCLRGGGG